MSSSVHANNKNKDMLVFGKVQTQGLDTTLTAEAEYSTLWFLFVNGTKIHQFKVKDSKIKKYPLC